MKPKFLWFVCFFLIFSSYHKVWSFSREKWVNVNSLSASKNIRNCSIRILYPKITATQESKLGAGIVKKVNKFLKKEFQDIKRYDNEYQCNRDAKKTDPAFHLEIKFDVKLNAAHFLSIYYYAVGFTAGAAHPENVYKAFNFDLREGELILFADLFRKNVGYLPTVNREIYLHLKEMDVLGTEEEFKEVEKKDYEYYLSKDGINIINLYEIHVMQSLEVVLSLKKMKKVLNVDKLGIKI